MSEDLQQDLRDEILTKFVGGAEKIKTSRSFAVKLHCVECVGGSSREAKGCTSSKCFLWPHAFGRGR